ncbi:hypothetical protein GCM10027451_42210 [Geodermatophilus aquaeductus]
MTGAGALLLAALPGVASADEGGGGRTWDVRPGQSIQAAVDAARSGDTIRIAPGTYREAVCVVGKGLTIQGAGSERTKIRWDRGTEPARTPCWEATNAADLEDDDAILADNVSAFFFLNPDKPVTVKDLQTRDHTANGVAAWGANGFTVTGTKGIGHDRYGILAANSRHIHIVGNVEEGVDRARRGQAPDAGTAGISVGDSANSAALVAGNRVRGYNLGVFLRESSGGRVDANHLSGNCVGILVFDDSGTEIPDRTRNVEGGDWRITANVSTANNRFCLQGREGDQRISGVGMAVVNASNVQISANVFRDNVPTLPPPPGVVVPPNAPPLTFPSGGLVMLTFPPPPPPAPQGIANPGQVTQVSTVANWFGNNVALRPVFATPGGPPTGARLEQMDIYVGDTRDNPFLGQPGPGLEFRHNHCDASYPANICGQPYPV